MTSRPEDTASGLTVGPGRKGREATEGPDLATELIADCADPQHGNGGADEAASHSAEAVRILAELFPILRHIEEKAGRKEVES